MAELTIVGVELTQAIQYFSINGQGSGYAPDNSVPLVAQRTTILRAYISREHAPPPNWLHPGPGPIPVRISGHVIVHRIQPNGSLRRLGVLARVSNDHGLVSPGRSRV